MKTTTPIAILSSLLLVTSVSACKPVRQPPDPGTASKGGPTEQVSAAADQARAKPGQARARNQASTLKLPPPPDVAAPPADAQKTASGLASKVLKAGKGEKHPTANDTVEVHYSGWTTDGQMFDSSVQRGRTIKFPLKGVIPGWTEGVQLMVEGEKRRFWIPEELAYKGRPGSPQGMLVFDVELIGIVDVPKVVRPEPIPAPADVAAPPADAQRTASGLSSKVLRPGRGAVKPKPTDAVSVNYTGWTTDGQMFDSSVARGQPVTFPLNRVIPGWTEGVGLMVVGEKRRLWIPEEQAYKGRRGAPQGMLVFDVELLEIILPPETPADVAAPPADAQWTASEMAFKVLKTGTGDKHPTAASQIEVHYSGWTTDGKMFDSSVTRGRPAMLRLGQVIPGWTEGLQLMVVGEKRRFWIPEELAYKGRPGAPQGMLVFDIELLKIID